MLSSSDWLLFFTSLGFLADAWCVSCVALAALPSTWVELAITCAASRSDSKWKLVIFVASSDNVRWCSFKTTPQCQRKADSWQELCSRSRTKIGESRLSGNSLRSKQEIGSSCEEKPVLSFSRSPFFLVSHRIWKIGGKSATQSECFFNFNLKIDKVWCWISTCFITKLLQICS